MTLQVASFDKNIREEIIGDSKDYKCQSLLTQAKRGEELVEMLSAFWESIKYYRRWGYGNESLKNNFQRRK